VVESRLVEYLSNFCSFFVQFVFASSHSRDMYLPLFLTTNISEYLRDVPFPPSIKTVFRFNFHISISILCVYLRIPRIHATRSFVIAQELQMINASTSILPNALCGRGAYTQSSM
jgi:hypothetical protein